MTRTKRPSVNDHDVLAVPLGNGEWGALHVMDAADKNNLAIVAHAARSSLPEALVDLVRPSTGLAVVVGGDEPVRHGIWLITGNIDISYPFARPDEFSMWYAYPLIEKLLKALHGLFPWDGMADPRYFEKQLLPGIPVPRAVRSRGQLKGCGDSFEVDFGTARTDFGQGSAGGSNGPATIEVEAIVDDGFEQRVVDRLLKLISAAQIGDPDVVELSQGAFFMAIQTQHGDLGKAKLDQLLSGMGLEAEVSVVSAEDDVE